MKIVVQKFGGTSVSTQENREKVAGKIIAAKKSGYSPVVTVSAIGRKGDPYATDTLIQLVEQVCPDTNPRELDLLLSCGEIISCVVLANTLKAKGYDSYVLTGGQAGIITDGSYGNGNVLRVEPTAIHNVLKDGKIPIVAGFQGITEDGNITTLGRGGSDTTGALLGEALKAHFIEIYTDVDGIMTADPRIVPNAKVLKTISYSEIFQIADQGAKVIHPRAVEIAMRSNIPLVIKNTANDSPGTIITSYHYIGNQVAKPGEKNLITSIAHISNRTQVTVADIDVESQDHLLMQFAENKISIDLINIFPDKIIFTIETKDEDKASAIFEANHIRYSMIHRCSKISAVGNRMRGVPGVMSRIIKALVRRQIKILQSSDSHTTISCLIYEDDLVNAVIALHDEFELWRN